MHVFVLQIENIGFTVESANDAADAFYLCNENSK